MNEMMVIRKTGKKENQSTNMYIQTIQDLKMIYLHDKDNNINVSMIYIITIPHNQTYLRHVLSGSSRESKDNSSSNGSSA